MRFGLMANAASGASAGGAQAPLTPSGRFSVYASAAAPTPPMGWNPWNAFRTDVDEAKIRGSARALVESGLAAQGYRYVNIDDGWALQRLDDGTLRIRDSMFPSSKVANSRTGSFKPFTDYLHGLGLRAGLYSDVGSNTCAQRWDAESANLPEGSVKERQVGSFGHAAQDMEQIFGTWRFDYIKIDACGVADYTADVEPVRSGHFGQFVPYIIRNDNAASQPGKVESLYATLGDAIRQWAGPEAVLSICAWGEALSPLWGGARGNLTRTSPDIEFTWNSMLTNIDSAVDGALYAGPGRWNDPDMLAVGHGDFDIGHPDEARAHVTMWAIMARRSAVTDRSCR
jgi:alpha-galactosidase